MMFEILLVIFAVAVLTASFYNLVISEGLFKENLGKSSTDLIEIDNEAGVKLFLIEDAALLNTFYSVIELSDNGGFSYEQVNDPTNKCKTWADCSLTKEKLIKNLQDNIEVNFNGFVKRQEISPYKINILVDGKNIKVKFSNKNADFSKNNIAFEINHEFEKSINYDLDKYLELYEKYKNQKYLACPVAELENNLVCNEEKEFLSFLYNQNIVFYLDEKSKVEYPLKPVITFRLPRPQI